MIIYPAIDIKDGKCVRLLQGRMSTARVYGDDPALMAKKWEEEGAEILHVVDLDGAVAGSPRNLEAISRIAAAVSIPVQVGGGIRDVETIRTILGLGASRCVLGTAAMRDPKMMLHVIRVYRDRVAAAIDARDGKVAVEGWKERTEVDAVELMRELAEFHIARVIYTNINLDGTERGLDFEDAQRFAEAAEMPVVISGGVTALDDIRGLKRLESFRIEGVIIGRALYEERFTLPQAIAAGK